LMNSRIISDIWPSFLSPPPFYTTSMPWLWYRFPLLLFPPASDRLAVSFGRCTQKNAMARSSKGFFFTINKNGQPYFFFKRRKIWPHFFAEPQSAVRIYGKRYIWIYEAVAGWCVSILSRVG
jgi:hypothetical protein